MFMARNNHGETLHNIGPHPRKGLMDRLGRKSARKMYIDKRDGSTVHIGYIVAGQWWTIYEVKHWEQPA